MKIEDSITIEGTPLKNRLVFQPMEGCDCLEDGSPSQLTKDKYFGFAKSGAGIIWLEATAVCKEGRTTPHQMMITEKNLPEFQTFVKEIKAIAKETCGYEPICIIQLTHSGRQSISPMCIYHNALYEATRPITDMNIVSDEYLDSVPAMYAKSALLAEKAGFDGIDVKSCHGYLVQECLSAYDRPGKYGGSLENRSRLYLDCFKAVKEVVNPTTMVVSRFDPSDVVRKPYGFGTDADGNVDLKEGIWILERLHEMGLRVVNITLGNPYYNPFVNRPSLRGMIKNAEDPTISCERFIQVGKTLKKHFPDTYFVGTGLSYYRGTFFDVAEKMLTEGDFDLIGAGRQTLAYPSFYQEYLHGTFDPRKTCVTCGKCAELKKNHYACGCAVYNACYHELYMKMKEESSK